MEQRKWLSNEQRTYLETTLEKLAKKSFTSTLMKHILGTGQYNTSQGNWLNTNSQRIKEWTV
jgi:hypothetical protein